MSEEMLGLLWLCRSFELASLEKAYGKKGLDAYTHFNKFTIWEDKLLIR